jgi:hypothetical protein
MSRFRVPSELEQYLLMRFPKGNVSPRMSSSTEDGLDSNFINMGVCSHDESIFLVAREGTKFPVSEKLARQCCPHFDGLFKSSVSEAGKFCICSPEPLSPF